MLAHGLKSRGGEQTQDESLFQNAPLLTHTSPYECTTILRLPELPPENPTNGTYVTNIIVHIVCTSLHIEGRETYFASS